MEILKARLEHYKEIEEILFMSFLSKFKKLLNLSESETINFLKNSNLINIEKNCIDYVFLEEGKVAGVLRLNIIDPEFKNDIKLKKTISILKIINLIGFLKTFKLFFGLVILSSHNNKGNCYIEHIAVSEEYRGKGIGTKLLVFGENVAKKYNQNKYTLYVAGDNKAKNLYERMGFELISSDSSLLTKYLFGYKDWIYMEKNIKNVTTEKYVFNKYWYLGFFGFIFFFKLDNILLFLNGEINNYFVLFNFLWLIFFLYFLPLKTNMN